MRNLPISDDGIRVKSRIRDKVISWSELKKECLDHCLLKSSNKPVLVVSADKNSVNDLHQMIDELRNFADSLETEMRSHKIFDSQLLSDGRTIKSATIPFNKYYNGKF